VFSLVDTEPLVLGSLSGRISTSHLLHRPGGVVVGGGVLQSEYYNWSDRGGEGMCMRNTYVLTDSNDHPFKIQGVSATRNVRREHV